MRGLRPREDARAARSRLPCCPLDRQMRQPRLREQQKRPPAATRPLPVRWQAWRRMLCGRELAAAASLWRFGSASRQKCARLPAPGPDIAARTETSAYVSSAEQKAVRCTGNKGKTQARAELPRSYAWSRGQRSAATRRMCRMAEAREKAFAEKPKRLQDFRFAPLWVQAPAQSHKRCVTPQTIDSERRW